MAEHGMCIAITGMGAVSPFGEGADCLWEALKGGRSGIHPLQHVRAAELRRVRVAAQIPADALPERHFSSEELALLDPVSQLSLVAAQEAVQQSGLDFSNPQLGARSGVVIGTGVGGEHTQDEQSRRLYGEPSGRVHPYTIVRRMMNAPASQVSMAHGLRGPSLVVTSACASTNHALAQAVLTLRAGLLDVVLAGGAESCLSFGMLKAWEAMRILAPDTCRPFSAKRHGLVLGEGAGMFVLERWDAARERDATILGELAGVGMSADAGDIVAPSAEGAAAAMQAALGDAGLNTDEIDYINAHGTGTQANDVTETRAIRAVFGAHADQLVVSSTKSMHGHALGASGALELVAVLGALREGVVPPTANYDEPDPECDLDVVPNTARAMPVRVALSNSFAFGGLNAVLALRAA